MFLMKRIFAVALVAFTLAGCNDSPTTPTNRDYSPAPRTEIGKLNAAVFRPDFLRVIDGQLWILESSNLSVFSFAGERTWTRHLSGIAKGFDRATDGTIYVADISGRISVYDNRKRLLRSWVAVETNSAGNVRLGRIALDGKGHLYVVDQGSAAIRKFDLDGTPILTWTGADLPEGHFESPRTILIDRDGNVVVGDLRTGQISTFTPDGQLLRSFSTGAFYLASVIQSPDGTFFVTEGGNRRDNLLQFSEDGNRLAAWSLDDDGLLYFSGLTTLAMDAQGLLYVGNSRFSRVTRFDQTGAHVDEFQILNPPGTFGRNLSGVAAGPDGAVYALNGSGGTMGVQKFSPDGVFIDQWGPPGLRVGQLNGARDLDVDAAGNVYVVDTEKLTKFDAQGRVLDWWQPTATALTVIQGYVYTVSGTRVQKLTTDGEIVWTWDGREDGLIGISDIASIPAPTPGPDIVLFVLDRMTAEVHELKPGGGVRRSWSVAEVISGGHESQTAHLEIAGGRLLVAEHGGAMIGVYSPGGIFLARWEALSEEYRPTTRPGFKGIQGLAADADGSVWTADRSARILHFGRVKLPLD